MTPYEVSGVHLAGLLKAARALGILESALRVVSPKSREMFASPHRQAWMPAAPIEELTIAIAQTSGPEMLSELNYRMSRDSIGPIVMPVLKVAMALTGRKPESLFSRLEDALSAAVRKVEVTWTSSTPTSGTLRLRYPVPLPPIVHHAWHGVLRFGFELLGREGRIAKHAYVEGDHVLVLDVEWK